MVRYSYLIRMKNRKPHLTALSLFWLLLDEKELTLLFLKRSGGGGRGGRRPRWRWQNLSGSGWEMQGVDITWDVIPSLPKIIFTKNVNHSWKLNILDRSFSLFFCADKLKALGVAEHFPFCVKVPEEANRKSKRSEKWNCFTLLNTGTFKGD